MSFNSKLKNESSKLTVLPNLAYKTTGEVIAVEKVEPTDKYGSGAHVYHIRESVGWSNTFNNPKFIDTYWTIFFCREAGEGKYISGVRNEDLYTILLDRLEKFNTDKPHKELKTQIKYLQKCIESANKLTVECNDTSKE